MNRFLALGLLAALSDPDRIAAQGRETDTLSTASPLARAAYLTQLDRLDDTRSAAAQAATVARHVTTPLAPLDLFRLETVSDPQLSPDGKHVVYVRKSFDIMRDREVTQLWMVNADGSMHRRLTAGDGNDRAPQWTPAGDAVIYLSSVDGTTQLFRRDVGSEQTVRLAKLPSTPEWFALSRDGSRIAFAMLVAAPSHVPAGMPAAPAGATWAPPAVVAADVRYRSDGVGLLPAGRAELFVMPSTGGTARQITSGGALQYGRAYGATPGIWTPDGAALIVTANGNPSPDLTSRSSDLFEVRVADGVVTPLFRRRGTNRSPAISPDGKWLAFVSVADSGHAWTQPRLWLIPRSGDAKPRLLSAKFDAATENPAWLPDGSGLLLLADREGRAGLWRITLDGTTALMADSLASDLEAYGGGQAYSQSPSGALALTRGSPTSPGDVWFAAAAGAPAKRLTAVNDDVLAERQVGQVSSFWAASSKDGQRFQSWIITPPGYTSGKKYPMILEIHGGPFAAYGDRFDIEKQWMAAQGYVVLYVNPRGSTSYGEAFARMIDKTYPGDDADDLLTAVDSVVARGLADPAQLYVTGGSGGGLLTAWLTARTNRFRAAAVLYPVIDWTSEVLTADNGSHFQGHWLRGAPWENPTHYWAQSPLSRVASVQTPTLVMGGDGDYRTPFGQSEEWFTALRLRGVPTELVRLPGEPHGARSRPSHHIAKVAYITDWFARQRDAACCVAPAPAVPSPALTALADSMARGDFGYVDALFVQRNGMPLHSRTFARNYDGVYPMKAPPGAYNYQDPSWHPFYQGRPLHTLQSVTKSIVSLVYGVALARKDITTIDQPIARFIPAHADAFRDSLRKTITIRHLLTMTSGIRWPEGGGYGSDDDITQRMENSADWVSMVLAQPMDTVPGAYVPLQRWCRRIAGRGVPRSHRRGPAGVCRAAPVRTARHHPLSVEAIIGWTDRFRRGALPRARRPRKTWPADARSRAVERHATRERGVGGGRRAWPAAGDAGATARQNQLRLDVVDRRPRRAAGSRRLLRLGVRWPVCLRVSEDAHGGGAEPVDVRREGDSADRIRAADRGGDRGDALIGNNTGLSGGLGEGMLGRDCLSHRRRVRLGSRDLWHDDRAGSGARILPDGLGGHRVVLHPVCRHVRSVLGAWPRAAHLRGIRGILRLGLSTRPPDRDGWPRRPRGHGRLP